MAKPSTDERGLFLSVAPADRRAIAFAFSAVALSALAFVITLPFARLQLAQINAFIPAYESTLVICDLSTAVLLFGQFNFLRSRALFVLASGYLFTACMALVHALSFPDVFSHTGLLGAGPQTTAWLYIFWHIGFPLFVIVYAFLRDEPTGAWARGDAPLVATRFAILGGVAGVSAIVFGLTFLATARADWLADLIEKGHFTASLKIGVASFLVLCVAALTILRRRRPNSVLDLWLMVVMGAWIFDGAISAFFNETRFDLGWYAGRVYGLVAGSSLFVVLLIETGTHYARLARLSAELGEANTALEQLSLHDALTGLANRRFFDVYLDTQIAVARRHKRNLALVLCDVDRFKSFNDHYGHQAGDECLKQVAAALQSACQRPADLVARYGGEEFAMILPDTDLEGAAYIAEAAREAVANLGIAHEHSLTALHVSISGGVAALLDRSEFSAAQLIGAADQTLFQAKREGRNRMVSAPAERGYEHA